MRCCCGNKLLLLVFIFNTHLTRYPHFSSWRVLWTLEPGFQCVGAKAEKSADLRFFFFRTRRVRFVHLFLRAPALFFASRSRTQKPTSANEEGPDQRQRDAWSTMYSIVDEDLPAGCRQGYLEGEDRL